MGWPPVSTDTLFASLLRTKPSEFQVGIDPLLTQLPKHTQDRFENMTSFIYKGSKTNGYRFNDNRGAVLGLPTIFNRFYSFQMSMPTWPSKEELRYEGQERIATDPIHRKFFPAPRVVGNNTVSWQQRPFSTPQAFDNFDTIPSEVDVFMRTHDIKDLEPNKDEGLQAIGKDLMELL